METTHQIFFQNSQSLKEIEDNSISCIITSPPYPMIEMWDELFFSLNKDIKIAFDNHQYEKAFILMNEELNKVWKECYRVLKEGGILAINIGDATRTLNDDFRLFTNHSIIINNLQNLGMKSLPNIIWRKPANKPNKFMGSGMLPVNAYLTLEHEYVLIFRKAKKRKFNKEEIIKRRESAYFWEERNKWFSDVWTDIVGENQKIEKKLKINRDRNAAFPLELALRLINMFSIYDDIILDPFLGTGTTMIASALLKRNSIGYEIDNSFDSLISNRLSTIAHISNDYYENRIDKHIAFVNDYQKKDKSFKHFNQNLNLPVITSQEKNIKFYNIDSLNKIDLHTCKVTYKEFKRNSLF